MVNYHLPCHHGASSRLLGGYPTRRQWTAWSGGWICPPGESRQGPWMHNGTHWDSRTKLVTLLFILVRTQVWIQACLRRQKGRLNTSQRILVTACWGETVSLRFRKYYTMWEYIKVQGWDAAQVRSEWWVDSQFHCELIRSRVSPTGALVQGLDRLTGAKELPKSPWNPSPSVYVLPSCKGRRWVEIRVKTLPWSI
jgi:hypothetical protein